MTIPTQRPYAGRLPAGVPPLPAYQRIRPRPFVSMQAYYRYRLARVTYSIRQHKTAGPDETGLEPRRRTDLASLIETVCAVFRVSRDLLLSPTRARAIARPRQALYLLLVEAGWSLSRAGRALRRDHTTISHGVRNAQRLMDVDPAYRDAIEAARRLMPMAAG